MDDPTTPADDARPLVVLLDKASLAFVEDFDRRLADSEFSSLSLAHSKNVLRFLGSTPTRASQIVAQCGVTKQAVSQQIAHLQQQGYLTVTDDPHDHRARALALTDKGRRAQERVEQIFTAIEAEWGRYVGAERLAEVRAVLAQLVPDTGC